MEVEKPGKRLMKRGTTLKLYFINTRKILCFCFPSPPLHTHTLFICFLFVSQVFSFPGDLQLRMSSIASEEYPQFDTVPG